ncbi:TrbI/VirB10 family protein [Sinorhizobium sp. 8-89]|uniref:TrbI/VirB10 family protein n=1 Tax=Sinorhizobium sp. 7-81 TaxID=3049087 RepID=UPI0024C2250B|nr:TrbI/VirB10 family protein [Sinorhizobium sp. 7-81]MDK1389580.1 TrbI/VirB10 family protein [Sinorhizobium sp. 7-81]
MEAGNQAEQELANSGAPFVSPMRLRPEPPRVTRISRKVLAGLGLAMGLGVGGALIYALRTPDAGVNSEELYSTDNRPTADGLAGLPKDYTGPILGPPLPGDLGRPILDAQSRGQPVVPPTIETSAVDPAEERRLAEAEAARTSRIFFEMETAPNSTAPDDASFMPGFTALGADGEPGSAATQERQLAFLNIPPARRTVSPDRISAPASPYVLQAGSVIAAALITGIRSDLPGQITAQVTENVYDSPTGRFLLVPQGTRLVGQYDSGLGFGQRRVLLVWNRLIMPNGRSIVLERQPGTDTEGYAGLEDRVDYHWRDLVKAAALSTLLGIGAELAADDNDRLRRALSDSAQDTVNDAGQEIVRRQLDAQPTLTIRPGFPVRVIVTRDLTLEPYGGPP